LQGRLQHAWRLVQHAAGIIGAAYIHDLRRKMAKELIDAGVSEPTLIGTGIPTGVLAERWKAGESIDELAEEYRRTPEDIQDALRWEFPAGIAA